MIDQPKGEKPALTVVIQSWWTPALAVIMLVVGLLAGYFGRPLLSKDAQPTGVGCCSHHTGSRPFQQTRPPLQQPQSTQPWQPSTVRRQLMALPRQQHHPFPG